MRWVRYLVGVISFVFVFFVVSFLVTFVTSLISRPESGSVSILMDWRGWIGLAAGLLAGVQSWNASVKRR
ncbi:hypothetical protein GC207_05825 [bacterium]|nr:hypothetical protein [bacterium]